MENTKSINEFSIEEVVIAINHYQEQARLAKKDVEANKAILGRNLQSNVQDPGELYMIQANRMQAVLDKLIAIKMERTLEALNGQTTKPVLESEGKIEDVKAPVSQMQPIEPVKPQESTVVEVPADGDNKEEEEVDSPDEINTGGDEEVEKEIEEAQDIALAEDVKEEIHKLASSKNVGVYLTDKDGKFIHATEKIKKDPRYVIENRTETEEYKEVVFSTKEVEKDGKKTRVKDTLLKDGNGKPAPVTKTHRKNKNFIIEKNYPFPYDIEVARSHHDIELAVNKYREHLKGQGIDTEGMSYRDLKARVKGVSQEVARAKKEHERKSLKDKLEDLKFKAERSGVTPTLHSQIKEFEGAFKKGDEFDLVVLNGGKKLKSVDKAKLAAIRLCTAGARKEAISIIMHTYEKQGVTSTVAEAILNKLMGDNPYRELEETVSNLLVGFQASETDTPYGYKRGISLAKTLVRAYSEVFKTDSNGNRVYEDESKLVPVMIGWQDEKVIRFISDIIIKLQESGRLPVIPETDENNVNTELKERVETKKKQNEAAKETQEPETAESNDNDSGKAEESGTAGDTATSDGKNTTSEESNGNKPEGSKVEVSYKPVGKAAIISIPGTSFNYKTRKVGKPMEKEVNDRLKKYMIQVEKSEKRYEQNPTGTTLIKRPTGMEGWKQGQKFVLAIVVDNGK